jgi:hypothetical protein
MKPGRWTRILGAAALAAMFVIPLAGATVATFVFDFVSDPGDVADGPDFDVTATAGLTDDTGTSCDAVVMIMADATGGITDVDSFCLSLTTGLGGSDMDAGSFGTGYLPVQGPITFALFDLTAADLTALSGFGDSDQEYADYVIANATCLDEQTLATSEIPNFVGLPTGAPFSYCGIVPTMGPGALTWMLVLLIGLSLVTLRAGRFLSTAR